MKKIKIYVLGYVRWILKPQNDHATLDSCIEYYVQYYNKK